MGSSTVTIRMVPLLLLLATLSTVTPHGFLYDPPARNAMWRFGFTNPVNYNDNELYCGGFSVQWSNNGGKCGVCGDNWADNKPRPHEAGGRYGNGVIGKVYAMGQTIDVDVDISANHWGHFELNICPVDGKNEDPTQECFDRHPLVLTSDPSTHKFYVPLDSPKITRFKYQVNLPHGLSCSQCVVQWTYYTGNTWGVCSNGTEGMGCGDQEMFRNCADVMINSVVGSYPPGALSSMQPQLPRRVQLYTETGQLASPLVVTARVCVATELYNSISGMDEWCHKSCLSYPPNCPADKCKCLSHCEAVGRLAGEEGTDVYCHRNCLRFPPNCPPDLCKCFATESSVSGDSSVAFSLPLPPVIAGQQQPWVQPLPVFTYGGAGFGRR